MQWGRRDFGRAVPVPRISTKVVDAAEVAAQPLTNHALFSTDLHVAGQQGIRSNWDVFKTAFEVVPQPLYANTHRCFLR